MRMRVRFVAPWLLLAAAAATAADQTVTVGPGMVFTDSEVTVEPGDTVTWTWAVGSLPHSTTSDSQVGPEVWDSGILLTGQFPHTFNTPGSYPYYCKVHSFPAPATTMNGIVHVVAATTPTNTPTRTPTPTATMTPTRTPTRTPSRTATPPIPSSFFSVAPCRVLDTRNAPGPLGGPALAAGGTRTFVLAGQCGIPPTAKAVSLNVTVTQPTAAGDLRLFPAGESLPLVSAINYGAGQTRANNAIAALGASGDLAVRCDQASGTVHLIVDVNGYSE